MTQPSKQVVQTTTVAQSKTAQAVGMVAETATCRIIATNAATGALFQRSFATYNALEQWLAMDASASGLDLTNMRIVPATSY